MLINKFLPEFDFNEIHTITINTGAEKVNASIFSISVSSLPSTKFLFKLRGMKSNTLLKEFIGNMFINLGNDNKEEHLFGLIGKFWALHGCLIKAEPTEFAETNPDGYAKAVWNFSIRETNPGQSILTTETRVKCIGKKAKLKFGIYWFLIRPFSGYIRKEILRAIKIKSEFITVS